MPRPIAFSAKQKRHQLQDKRAVERGELDPSQVRFARNPDGNYRPGASHLPDPTKADTTATRHISKFVSLTPEYVARARDLAHSVPLTRPIPDSSAVFPVDWMERDGDRLTCPTRPEFDSGQAKEDLEGREQEAYNLWLKDTTATMQDWLKGSDKGSEENKDDQCWRSPTWFETNLEVWRQLYVPTSVYLPS